MKKSQNIVDRLLKKVWSDIDTKLNEGIYTEEFLKSFYYQFGIFGFMYLHLLELSQHFLYLSCFHLVKNSIHSFIGLREIFGRILFYLEWGFGQL